MASQRSNALRAPPKPKPAEQFRLRRLKVENFRALEKFEFVFPDAETPGEPDIFVLGSQNGMGKTSILEAISLVIMGAALGPDIKLAWRREMRDYGPDRSALNYGDYFVRSGADHAAVSVDLDSLNGGKANASIQIDRELQIIKQEDEGLPRDKFSARHDPEFFISAISSLVGSVAEPLFLDRLIYLHSYRKVVEGMPDFGDFIRSDRRRRLLAMRRGEQASFSAMKTSVLAALIGQSDLFETIETGRPHPADTLKVLNSLLERFAGGQISKMKAELGSKIDIRVSPKNGGPSFSFDGLSSGQKEIVSTLFLIWQQTYRRPSIVLIDEPELHLNAEWHKVFVEELYRVAPLNQYILATHSEHVAESVPSHRRAIMRNVKKAK